MNQKLKAENSQFHFLFIQTRSHWNRSKVPKTRTEKEMAESCAQPMRLKEWLLQQIDSGHYPGLRWENPEKTVFRIPWKHAAKQDYREQADAALFKAWAMYKGKFREGSGRADPSVWKTRLRCALNKSPDFQEVMENSQIDLSEPYKIYRIVTPTQERNEDGYKKASRSPTKDLPLKQTQKPIVGECKSTLKEMTQVPVKEESPYSSQEETEKPNMGEVLQIQVCKRQMYPEPCRSESLRTDIPHPPKATSCHTPMPILWTTPHSDYRVLDLSTKNEGLPSSSSLSDFWLHVRLYYQDRLVTEVTTKSAEGCRIVPWSTAPQQFSPCSTLSLEVVSLPFPPELSGNLNPDMNGFMQKLVKHLEQGVLLWVAPEGVFVKRQCQVLMYWSGQLAPHSDQPNKLERERTYKVLDTEQFLHELNMYVTQGAPEPQYQIQLCFGEEYPDTSGMNPKIQMMALVEPVFARELLLNAQRKVMKDFRKPDLQPPGASSALTSSL